MIHEDSINVYTDGSSYSNPRKGGMGIRIIIINDQKEEETYDIPYQGFKGATNNAMELLACINGIKEACNHHLASKFSKICVSTDSMYVVNNYKNAIFQWQRNKWKNRYGRPIENAELWKEFIKTYKNAKKRIEINWVKGHAKDLHNKAVDKSAKQSAKGLLNKPLKVQNVRKKYSDSKTIIGSIIPEGQKISIYIIADEYFRIQKCYKYRCKVISKKSKYNNKIDFLYSDHLLKAGHNYYVILNKDPNNPSILKVIKELEN